MINERVYKMAFSSVYPLLVKKAERKGRTKFEVDAVICWLTGYDDSGLHAQIAKNIDYETLFSEAPQIRRDLRTSCRGNQRPAHAENQVA